MIRQVGKTKASKKKKVKRTRIISDKKKYYILERKYWVLVFMVQKLDERGILAKLEKKNISLKPTQLYKTKKTIKHDFHVQFF